MTGRFQRAYGTVGSNTPWQPDTPAGDRAGHAVPRLDFAVSARRSVATAASRRGPVATLDANLRRKMRPWIALLVVGLIGPGLSATAFAGAFGGFARDGKSYLDGADRVCQPIARQREISFRGVATEG